MNAQTMAQDAKKQGTSGKRVLVTYFSATGTTAATAEKIAKATGGDIHAITPAKAYTNADLNWHDKQSRSSIEMHDPKSRPAIKDKKENIADYEVIFIGYPIWWDLAPRVINTFIESHNLKGKTIILFATSGGTSITGSVTAMKKTYPELNWKDGKLLNRTNEKTIKEWLDKLEY